MVVFLSNKTNKRMWSNNIISGVEIRFDFDFFLELKILIFLVSIFAKEELLDSTIFRLEK